MADAIASHGFFAVFSFHRLAARASVMAGSPTSSVDASNFGNYNATYGALSAVVVLLMWLYLSAYVLLLDAELNAELERHANRAAGNAAPKPLSTGVEHA